MQTIAAIATASGPAGIGVIRISGQQALEVAGRVFTPYKEIRLEKMQGYTAAYGVCKRGAARIDEAVALVFRAPNSYTGEDVVELSCHGGSYILKKVLEAVLAAGASPAGPGEFTKRAYLNGKMRLTQAESVMDLIKAQGEQALRAALSERAGALHKKIEAAVSQITGISAQILAYVDYPDDEIETLDEMQVLSALYKIAGEFSVMLEEYDQARILRDGVHTVIVGRPNVGKSTLMNLLLGFDRSIVTEIPGTTRDIVEESVRLGDLLLRLSDTAGIRESEDKIERIGVEKTRALLAGADLILALFDGSAPLCGDDIALMEQLKGRNVVALVSKSDLPLSIDTGEIKRRFKHVVVISAAAGAGIRELIKAVEDAVGTAGLNLSGGICLNERQRDCIRRAKKAVEDAISALKAGFTPDVYCIHLDEAAAALLELNGERVSDRVVEEIFSRFCVGK